MPPRMKKCDCIFQLHNIMPPLANFLVIAEINMKTKIGERNKRWIGALCIQH